ncbi:MAG: RidA family protein [Nocardioidaceae bacterium]|nr:RidA family protein [Nocardioidaceae bacterium]
MLSDEVSDPAAELAGVLSPPPSAQGGYLPAVAHAGVLVTAGMTPRVDGVLHLRGQVGTDLSVDEAQEAAAVAVGNALSAALAALDPGQQLDRVLRMTVYVNAAPGFTEHTAVADGASSRLRELLGERGAASRTAVGVTSLPGGACVELDLTCSWHELEGGA